MTGYLTAEWDNYNDQHGWKRVALVSLSILEDGFRLFGARWQPLRPIWFLRGRLTEGKTRRMLRRVTKHWKKTGIYEVQYFDCGDRALSITFAWQDIRAMKGYQNEK